MNFRYQKFPLDQDKNPFPENKSALRPVIQIDLAPPNGSFGYTVLVDSGADYCIFHGAVGDQLGLNVKSGKILEFHGTSGQLQKAYFHKVKFLVGGHEHVCMVGFSYDLDAMPYGILGQDGFFDKWSVRFERYKENIELKPK